MKKIAVVLCAVFSSVVVGAAQDRTITNSDLTKYTQERVKADADLRENYAKLGFASPEERARRNAESAKETAEISARLRAERIERERIEAQTAANERYAAAFSRAVQQPVMQNVEPSYFGGYYYERPRIRRTGWPPFQQEGYFASGQFWPTGARTRVRPLYIRPRN